MFYSYTNRKVKNTVCSFSYIVELFFNSISTRPALLYRSYGHRVGWSIWWVAKARWCQTWQPETERCHCDWLLCNKEYSPSNPHNGKKWQFPKLLYCSFKKKLLSSHEIAGGSFSLKILCYLEFLNVFSDGYSFFFVPVLKKTYIVTFETLKPENIWHLFFINELRLN